MYKRSLLAVFTLLAGTQLYAVRAAACSGTPGCAQQWVAPAGGDLQSDEFALVYYTEASEADGGSALPRLTRIDDAGVVDVPYDSEDAGLRRFKLTPREPQPVGATIRLETDMLGHCSLDQLLSEEYHVIAPQPAPSALGTLQAQTSRAQLPIGTNADHSCWADVDAVVVDLQVQLDPSAVAFDPLLSYALIVDGTEMQPLAVFQNGNEKPWSLAHGAARLFAYAACSTPTDVSRGSRLTFGKHTAHVLATSSALSLSTPDVEFELGCVEEPDAGVRVDGGVTTQDAGIAAAPDAAPENTQQAQSRGCQLASPHAVDGATWLLALALLPRRKRRLV